MKIVIAQTILRRLAKEAGLTVPLAIGAGIVASAEGTKKALERSRQYHAAFNPNFTAKEAD